MPIGIPAIFVAVLTLISMLTRDESNVPDNNDEPPIRGHRIMCGV